MFVRLPEYLVAAERVTEAVLNAARNKTDPVSRWAVQVQQRWGYWQAVVAVAAKNARICVAMLQRVDAFKLSV